MRVNTKELINYDPENLDVLKDMLETDGYDTAYGDTYSIKEVRKFIKAQQPVFAEMGSNSNCSTLFFVGENPNSLIAYRDGESYAIPDKDLQKAWTGNIVAVLQKAEVPDKIAKDDKEAPDFVIFDSNRDRWAGDKYDIKIKAKEQIADIKNLPEEVLPSHPVIVIFAEPEKAEKKKQIRAMTNGAEIQIFDSSDPVTEVLHEIGHVYWNTRLSKTERKAFEKLIKKIDKKNMPGIFLAKWEIEHPEELFCTVYYWYLRGMLTNKGYLRILTEQYPAGSELMSKIFTRVRQDLEISEVLKAQKIQIEDIWEKNKRNLLLWVNQLTNTPTLTAVKGKGLMKAMVPAAEPVPVFVPDRITYKLVENLGEREWILIKSGMLKNKYLVLKNSRLDIPFMKAKGEKYFHVPLRKMMKANGIDVIKIEYANPERFEKAKREGLVPVKVQVTKKGKTYTTTVWKRVTDLDEKQRKQVKWFDKMLSWFGVGTAKEVRTEIESAFVKGEVPIKFDVNVGVWVDHVLEYFRNKDLWDSKFGDFVKEQKPEVKKLNKKKIKEGEKAGSKIGSTPSGKDQKNEYNLELMKFVWDKYKEKPGDKKKEAKGSTHIADIGGMVISKYTAKSIIISGETYPNLDLIRSIKESLGTGTWSGKQKGWIFPASHEKTILEKLRQGVLAKSEAIEEKVNEITTDKTETIDSEVDIIDSKDIPPPEMVPEKPIEEIETVTEEVAEEPAKEVGPLAPTTIEKIYKYDRNKIRRTVDDAFAPGTSVQGDAYIKRSYKPTSITGIIKKAYMYDPKIKDVEPYLVYDVSGTYKGAFGKPTKIDVKVRASNTKELPRMVVKSEDNFETMPEEFNALRKFYHKMRENEYIYKFGDRYTKPGKSSNKSQVTRNTKLFKEELDRFEMTMNQKVQLGKMLEKMYKKFETDQSSDPNFNAWTQPETSGAIKARENAIKAKADAKERMKTLDPGKVKVGTVIRYKTEFRDWKTKKLVFIDEPTIITHVNYEENSIQYGYRSPRGGTGFFYVYPDKPGRDKFKYEVLEGFDIKKYAQEKLEAIRKQKEKDKKIEKGERIKPTKADSELTEKELGNVRKAAEKIESNFEDSEKMRVLKEALPTGTIVRFRDTPYTAEVIDRLVVSDIDGSPIVKYIVKDDQTKRLYEQYRTDIVRLVYTEDKDARTDREIAKAMEASAADTRPETQEALFGEPDAKISENESDYATATYLDPELQFKSEKMTIGGMERNVLNYADIPNDKIRLMSEKNILKSERPSYIPDISLADFEDSGYRIEAFRIGPDRYAFKNSKNELVVGTLATAAAAQDYYVKKSKILAKQNHEIEREKYAKELKSQGLSEDAVNAEVDKTMGKVKRLKTLNKNRITRQHLAETAGTMQIDRNVARTNAFDSVLAVKQKIKDLSIHTKNTDSTYFKGKETSYSKTNVSTAYQEDLGILVKRQNGDKINPREAEQLAKAMKSVYKVFGDKSEMAKKTELIISHAGGKYQHASEADGIFAPLFGAIGISAKKGENVFNLTAAHEFSHYMDYHVGNATRHSYSSDREGSIGNTIAVTFRNNMTTGKGKMASATMGTYSGSTTECFARAFEQYFAIKTGREKTIDWLNEKMGTYMENDAFKEKVFPLIDSWMEENESLLKAFMNNDHDRIEHEIHKRNDGFLSGLKRLITVKKIKPNNVLKATKRVWVKPSAKRKGHFREQEAGKKIKDKKKMNLMDTAEEHGVSFKTGNPVEFEALKLKTEHSKKIEPGNPYQRKLEPAGNYITHKNPKFSVPADAKVSKIKFNNPLVVKINTKEGEVYGSTSWKANLSKQFDGKTGKSLSQAIADKGFDGIVTVETYKGTKSTSEIVDLSMFKKK